MEIFFWAAIALASLVLGFVSFAALIKSISLKKKSTVKYGILDILSYVLDALLLIAYIFVQVLILGFAMMGSVDGWQKYLLNAADLISIFSLPLSVSAIAASIRLRKQGKSGLSFLAQFSTLPLYVAVLLINYTVLM